ncbi:MAG TPA: caspase family protein [Capsulimonadaceae bacterium]|jgi:WD40 repeat protein
MTRAIASCLSAFVAAVVFTAFAARADEPPTAPILRVETGTHLGNIGQIATDSAGRYLASASFDKTLRVWDLATGQLETTIRPPCGDSYEGAVYAVAMSPDGNVVASGGNTGYSWDVQYCVYLFDRRTGEMKRRLTELPSTIDRMAWSSDGLYLAVACSSGEVRVYKTTNWKVAGADTKCIAQRWGISFSNTAPDSSERLVTTAFDGSITTYSLTASGLSQLARVAAPGGKQPYSCAYSPDGTRIAITYNDSIRVDVLSAKDLSRLYSPSVEGLTPNWNLATTWSRDGSTLLAGGAGYSSLSPQSTLVRSWQHGGQGAYSDTPIAPNTITSLLTLPSGGYVAASADPTITVFDSAGRKTVAISPSIANLHGSFDNFTTSADGTDTSFSFKGYGIEPATFSLASRQMQQGSSNAKFVKPITYAPGVDIKNWQNMRTPSVNGVALTLQSNEFARSVAIAPARTRFLLGAEWTLYCFAPNGAKLWSNALPADASAVNVSADGRVGIVACDDGTIRWYRMIDGQGLLTFFPHADQKRWVAWTPSGYYDCSPGGEDLIGWQVNRGKDHSADFFPASRFRDQFYRPDVIAKAITALDEKVAVSQADAEAGRKTVVADIATKLPPVVTILSPTGSDPISSDTVTVRYSVRTPSGEPATTVRVLVNGRPAVAAKRIQLVSADGQTDTATVTVPHADCTISVIAENRFASSEAATVSLKWSAGTGNANAPTALTPDALKPKLYILAVGVAAYKDKDLTLTYPGKDAADFAAKMVSQKGLLYGAVTVKALTDAGADKASIEDGLQWIQQETTSRDVAMVFLSGHGALDPNGNYLFVPYDFDRARYKSTGIPFSDFTNTLQAIAGKAIFFFDSCHSGNVSGRAHKGIAPDVTRIVNDLSSAENGTVVFSSSTGSESSYEDPVWGNGAFTKALLEGLNGKADAFGKGKITIATLDAWIAERVKDLTNGTQHPTTQKPPSVPDFPLAIVH